MQIHQGHRKRIMARLMRDETMYDHEILECLLFFVIPRKNTNPIGHELMYKFKSIRNVFKADKKDLKSVKGIGDESIRFIKDLDFVLDHVEDYTIPLAVGRSRFELDRVLDARFYLDESGAYHIVSINLDGSVKSILPFSDKGELFIIAKKIFRYLNISRPCGIVVVHTRARGSHFIENDEVNALALFGSYANLVYVKLFNYIVYDKGRQIMNFYNDPEGRIMIGNIPKLDYIKTLIEWDEKERLEELSKQPPKNYDDDPEDDDRYPRIGDVFTIKK